MHPLSKTYEIRGKVLASDRKAEQARFPLLLPMALWNVFEIPWNKAFCCLRTVASLSQTKFHISHFYYNGNLALYPTRSQAGTVQKKQEQEPMSVCRDVPELRTFSASERATAAMGHNCMSSAESPPHLLALSHGSPSSWAFFLPTKGRGVKACLLSYLYLLPVSGTNQKLPSKLYVKRWWQMSWVGFVIGKRKSWGLPT